MASSPFSCHTPERASTKVRIVFDGSAPYEGKSLNTEALPGPKLQSNVFDILVKFRKETVALAGDISQMYHQLVLREEDRPLHRFLWRNLDPSKEPEVFPMEVCSHGVESSRLWFARNECQRDEEQSAMVARTGISDEI